MKLEGGGGLGLNGLAISGGIFFFAARLPLENNRSIKIDAAFISVIHCIYSSMTGILYIHIYE